MTRTTAGSFSRFRTDNLIRFDDRLALEAAARRERARQIAALVAAGTAGLRRRMAALRRHPAQSVGHPA
ncbi:MAG: hypothetical protein IPK81_12725 [Rhodospirillales bacterium]|nr:MAG: hypothetical protein IPK81_12725 [Rhodospirillales bacterium]